MNSGLVLIAGGEVSDGSGAVTETASAELYDPNAGTFSPTGSLNMARTFHTATLLASGMVLIAGGDGTNGDPAPAELYDPSAGSFSTTGSLNTPRDTHSATLLNDGTVLIAGGESSLQTAVAIAELYNPTTGIFTNVGSLNTASVGQTASLLNTGSVLIAGGSTSVGGTDLARAELYNPSTQLFTVTGSLVTAASSFTATMLSSGDVLIVGGFNSSGQVVGTGELYDPVAGAFSLAGNLNDARGGHSAALLTDGLVLITGGVDSSSLELASAETYQSVVVPPAPPSLQVTPAVVNMLVGGTQQFTAIDNLGIPRFDATWTVSNPSFASVSPNPNGTAILTGLAAGQVTITATAEGVSAQGQATILSETSFPSGATIWSAPPPAPGFSVIQLAQAVPSANGPDLYSISLSADGTQSIIQALMADGEQIGQIQVPPLLNNAVPDGSGGLIITTCPSGAPLTVVDLGPAGQPLWQLQAEGVQGYGYICAAPQIAVRGDGVAFIAEPSNSGLPSLSEAYPNGSVESMEFQGSTLTNNGSSITVQCCVGPPMVNTDGTLYVEYEVRNTNNNAITSDTLYLYGLNGNTASEVVLSSTTQNQALLPGPIIPDGQGGVLATWTVSSPVVQQYPYQAADVTNGVAGTPYSLPFSPQSVTFQQSPTLVLGENGVAFASGQTTAADGVTQVSQIASFNLTSGSTNWTYQAPAQTTLSIIQATAGGGVTINSSGSAGNAATKTSSRRLNAVPADSGGNSGVIQLDSGGNTLGTAPALNGAVPFDLSTWVSTASGVATALWNPDGTNGILTVLAQSASPLPHGNQPGQNQPPFCHRGNVNCALAPVSDYQDQSGVKNRAVTYSLFDLQNGTLNPLVVYGKTPPPVEIELWEANATTSAAIICSWQTNNPGTICKSPNNNGDGFGQFTDHMDAPVIAYSVQMQLLVDRQGVQVFWPNSNGTWYGAWGSPSPTPPGFYPNQTASDTADWGTITQINPNTSAPALCPIECDKKLPNAGP